MTYVTCLVNLTLLRVMPIRYVACQQALASSSQVDSYLADQSNWRALERLASDGIVGVRIGVARLAGCLFGAYKYHANGSSVLTRTHR